MSHEVENMVFAGETPWHGLGVKIGDNLTPQQILEAAHLDWTVSKRPIQYPSKDDSGLPVDDRFALVRDSDDQFLDIVGKVYRPTQNKDAFEFFDGFVKETKLRMHTAGSLCQGKYVWALAEMDKHFTIGPDKDRIESYILLVSPHQFGKSLIAQHTATRVVCMNTLRLALSEGGVTYRMTHGREFDARARMEAGKVLGLATESFKHFREEVKTLAETKISRDNVIELFGNVLSLKNETLNDLDSNGLPKSRLLKNFVEAYDGGAPGANLSGSKGTLWGAVNAVTYVMDHGSVRNKEKALRDNLFGYRGDLKNKALVKALAIAA
jgi:phage/plasmid-like protein (TIGR03299 family)